MPLVAALEAPSFLHQLVPFFFCEWGESSVINIHGVGVLVLAASLQGSPYSAGVIVLVSLLFEKASCPDVLPLLCSVMVASFQSFRVSGWLSHFIIANSKGVFSPSLNVSMAASPSGAHPESWTRVVCWLI